METKGFFQLAQMSWLALSDSFEYVCYGSTAINNISIISAQGPSPYVFWRIKTVPALKGLIMYNEYI